MTLVHVADHGRIAIVTIDRPPANALAPDLVADLLVVLDRLDEASPAAVVLTGAGRFFSGGADLRLVPQLPDDAMAQLARDTNALFARWYELQRPLVTAVNGHTVAGGMVLALCGDVRVGPTSGQFGLTEVRAGIPFPSAAMSVVRGELAPGSLRRMVLRSELFDAATALDFGCFDEVVADDDVLDRAVELAGELAALPPRSFEAAKARIRTGAFDRDRGRFGGAVAARDATAESRDAAKRLLDDR